MTLKKLLKDSRIRIWSVILIFLLLLAGAAYAGRSEDFRFQRNSKVDNFTGRKKGGALIVLKWDSLADADGYELFRYNSGQKEYLLIKDIHSGEITSYKDRNMNAHMKQKYMIRAYRTSKGTKILGEESRISAGGLNGSESIGHRGAMEYAPDDTIASFAKAKSLGYKTFECDVWNTHSGELFIFHDPVLNLLTDGSGAPTKLSRDNYLSFPLTHGKNADRYELQYPPDFEEVVKWASEHDMNLMLHIKDSGIPHHYMCFLRMEQILSRYHMINRSIVFTSNKKVLSRMSHFSFRTGFLTLYLTSAARFKCINIAKHYGCDLVIMKYTDSFPLTAKVVNYSHEQGIPTACYNIERRDQIRHLISVRGDYWITNRVLFTRQPAR